MNTTTILILLKDSLHKSIFLFLSFPSPFRFPPLPFHFFLFGHTWGARSAASLYLSLQSPVRIVVVVSPSPPASVVIATALAPAPGLFSRNPFVQYAPIVTVVDC
jgi:pimeloyl-ACP methyl ester carboxylesterase